MSVFKELNHEKTTFCFYDSTPSGGGYGGTSNGITNGQANVTLNTTLAYIYHGTNQLNDGYWQGNAFTNSPNFTNALLFVTNAYYPNYPNYNGVYKFWSVVNTYGYIRFVWTNLAGCSLQFAPGANTLSVCPGTDAANNHFQSQNNPQNGQLIKYNIVNGYFTNFIGSGFDASVYQLMQPMAIFTLGTVQNLGGNQVLTGNFSGNIIGSVSASAVDTVVVTSPLGSPIPPIDPNWNSYSASVPQIIIGQWPSLYDENQMTNFIWYSKTNGCLIDIFDFDITWVGQTNGNLFMPYTNSNPWATVHATQPIAFYVNYIHTNNMKVWFPLERYPENTFNSNSYPLVYNFSTPGQLANHVDYYWRLGGDGISVDHLGANSFNPQDPTYKMTEFAFPAALYNAVQNERGNTNLAANNIISSDTRPFALNWIGLSRFDYCMNLASSYLLNDVVLSDNGLGGPFTGFIAESNYVRYVTLMTNCASWSRPGHSLWSGDIDTSTPAFDTTNQFNLCCILANTVGISVVNGTSTNGNPVSVALGSVDLIKNVLKDPLVIQGYFQTNLIGGTTNTDLWVRPLANNKYAFLIWNHSANICSNVSFPISALSQSFGQYGATTLIHDPWKSVDVETNSTGIITRTNLAAYQTLLLVASRSSLLAATNTLTVLASGVTNNTTDTYSVSVTAGTSMSVADGNGTAFLTPVINSSFPLKPNWRFTGTAVTGTAVILNR